MEKIKFERFLTDATHVHIQNGNAKTGKGIYTINLLAGASPLTLKDGTTLTNVSGTCKGCCEGCCESACYARNTQIYRNSNIPTWADNTLLALYDIDTYFREIQNFINKNMVAVIRFHAFGEIPSYEYFLEMVTLANTNPDVKFYTYTKRFNFLEKFLCDGGAIPKNLVINVSIWHGNYENKYGLPEFIYDDGAEKLDKIPHCPAVDKDGQNTGITCAMCKRCINAKQGTKTAVYAH